MFHGKTVPLGNNIIEQKPSSMQISNSTTDDDRTVENVLVFKILMIFWPFILYINTLLQAGTILAVSRRVCILLQVKFEIPMALQRPFSTSCSIA